MVSGHDWGTPNQEVLPQNDFAAPIIKQKQQNNFGDFGTSSIPEKQNDFGDFGTATTTIMPQQNDFEDFSTPIAKPQNNFGTPTIKDDFENFGGKH